jgi:ribonuclease J
MNAALYGFGPPKQRKWILVDCGMGFGSEEHLPGIDLVYPDLTFIEERRDNLLGIFITHAHEDHIGALVELWPRLQRAGLRHPLCDQPARDATPRRGRRTEDPAPRGNAGSAHVLGPFDLEYVPVAHSIPESNASRSARRSGSWSIRATWKLDTRPISARPHLRRAASGPPGRTKGVLGARICDSTQRRSATA